MTDIRVDDLSTLRARAQGWRDEDPDAETRAELETLITSGSEADLADHFGSRLQFGTAGLRGILGPGPNRMNRVMVRRATAGLGAYLKQQVANAAERGVVVGYDGRKNSRVFAEDTARVLLGAGLKVHLFPFLVPTPLTAFAVTHLNAAGGVMVTASHNPPEYNGYKVYWETGGQIVPPHDSGISSCIDAIGRTDALPLPDLDEARATGDLVDLDEDLVEHYLEGVAALSVHPEAPKGAGLVLAYTPLHGVGAVFTEQALARAGFDAVHVVAEQREPDGGFPTVRFPNPEEPGAMDAVLALAAKVGADLALAADPDADRLAVALPDAGGNWKMLTGDQVGILLAHYLLTEGGGGPERAVANSIVSSRMLASVARSHGITHLETLTGFKWIAHTAITHKAETGSRLVMGYEEALGYSVGELVRDKDGVSAVAIFAEMAAWLKQNGRTVFGLLEEAYRRYGLYVTRQVSLTFKATEMARIVALMEKTRAAPPEHIGDWKVVEVVDLARGGSDLPPTDLVLFRLEGDGRVLVRPSGTEPKLKSYYEVKEDVGADETLADARGRAESALEKLVTAHQALLGE
jgi:phosphomannomutase